MFLLGHDLSWNSHCAGIADAGGSDERALHGFGKHPFGRGIFFEGAPSPWASAMVHGTVWSNDQRDRDGVFGLCRTMGAERTGVGFHHAVAILVCGDRRGDSRRRTFAWSDAGWNAGGTGRNNAAGNSGHPSRGFRRPRATRISGGGSGLLRLVPGIHSAAAAQDDSASGGERSSAATGYRTSVLIARNPG